MQQPSLPFDESPQIHSTGVHSPEPAPSTLPQPAVPTYEFVRSRRARRYVIRLRPDGSARVTIPPFGTRREALQFARSQQQWIERQRARIAAANAEPKEQLSAALVRELWDRARRELPQRLMALAQQFGLRVDRVSVRNQRWRWGSCSRGGHICLNWRLVRMPDWVSDYVLIHELMHLKRMDHSPRFWKLVARACPRYEEARAWLRASADRQV